MAGGRKRRAPSPSMPARILAGALTLRGEEMLVRAILMTSSPSPRQVSFVAYQISKGVLVGALWILASACSPSEGSGGSGGGSPSGTGGATKGSGASTRSGGSNGSGGSIGSGGAGGSGGAATGGAT